MEKLKTIVPLIITAILITTTGIIYHQSFLNILPLYISLFVMAMQANVNRYNLLLGSLNSLLYAYVYWYYGLMASAAYAVLFSFPLQLIAFINWNRHAYKQATVFKAMTGKQRAIMTAACLVAWLIVYAILKAIGSNYQLLDNTGTLLGIIISVLTMLKYIEYLWLMLPSGILSIVMWSIVMQDKPEQITYLIFSVYSMICVLRAFFKARALYLEQQNLSKSEAVPPEDSHVPDQLKTEN